MILSCSPEDSWHYIKCLTCLVSNCNVIFPQSIQLLISVPMASHCWYFSLAPCITSFCLRNLEIRQGFGQRWYSLSLIISSCSASLGLYVLVFQEYPASDFCHLRCSWFENTLSKGKHQIHISGFIYLYISWVDFFQTFSPLLKISLCFLPRVHCWAAN